MYGSTHMIGKPKLEGNIFTTTALKTNLRPLTPSSIMFKLDSVPTVAAQQHNPKTKVEKKRIESLHSLSTIKKLNKATTELQKGSAWYTDPVSQALMAPTRVNTSRA